MLYHIKDMRRDSVNLFIGKTHTGKSHLLKFTFWNFQRYHFFDFGIGFSKTIFNGSLDFIPAKHKFDKFDEEKVRNLLELMKQFKEQGIEKHAYLVLDDMIGSIKLNAPIWDTIASMCRHYNITVFITTQYVYKIPPILRSNASYIFCCKVVRHEDIKCLAEEYSVGMTPAEFLKMFNSCTDNYGVLVIDNASASSNPREVYSVIRAPAVLPKFLTHQ